MDPTSSFNGEPPKGSVPHGNDLSGMRNYVEETTYDEVGNITRMRHLTGVSNSESWTRDYAYFPGTNRLEGTSAPGGLPGNTNAKYEYSTSANNNAGLHGSMTRMPHLDELHWDFADRLQHVVKQTGGNQQSYYVYDASGQRVRKVYEHGQVDERIYLSGVEIYRKRAGAISDPVEVERVTLHVNDDTRRVAMVETKTIDANNEEPHSPLNQGRWRYQLDNHLGSSAMEIDGSASANVISYEEYHPYGSTAFHLWSSSAEVSAKRYRYTGKEKDEESGLYYHGARYYAALLGRWTAADPAGLIDGLNLYRYSRDNPVNFSDPNGTESQGDSTRRNLGQYNFTGNETRSELESLANQQGYTIVGTPTWNAERKGWELGQIQRLPSESSDSITFEDDYITARPPTEGEASKGNTTGDAEPLKARSDAATHAGPALERAIYQGRGFSKRGFTLEHLYNNDIPNAIRGTGDNRPLYDVEDHAQNRVKQIKSSTAGPDGLRQHASKATRDAAEAIQRNPTGTMAGKQAQGVVITPTDAPPTASADIRAGYDRMKHPVPNSVPPEHVRGLPGQVGKVGRALTVGGAALSGAALAADLARGDYTMAGADAISVAGGAAELYALASPGASIAGVSAVSAGLALGGVGIAAGSAIQGVRAYRQGDKAGAAAGAVGFLAGAAITAGVIAGAPALLAGGLAAAAVVGLFHLGRWALQ